MKKTSGNPDKLTTPKQTKNQTSKGGYPHTSENPAASKNAAQKISDDLSPVKKFNLDDSDEEKNTVDKPSPDKTSASPAKDDFLTPTKKNNVASRIKTYGKKQPVSPYSNFLSNVPFYSPDDDSQYFYDFLNNKTQTPSPSPINTPEKRKPKDQSPDSDEKRTPKNSKKADSDDDSDEDFNPRSNKQYVFDPKSRYDIGDPPPYLQKPRTKQQIDLKNCDFVTLYLPELAMTPYTETPYKDANYYKTSPYLAKQYDKRPQNSPKKGIFKDPRSGAWLETRLGKIDNAGKYKNAEEYWRYKGFNNVKEHSEFMHRKSQLKSDLDKKQTLHLEIEWLHSLADSYGSYFSIWNMSAATFPANTQMMVLENELAKQKGIAVEVTTYLKKDTKVAEWYTYTVYAYDQNGFIDKLTFEIDARLEWYNENSANSDQKLIKDFLNKTEPKRKFIPENTVKDISLPILKAANVQNAKEMYPQPGFIVEDKYLIEKSKNGARSPKAEKALDDFKNSVTEKIELSKKLLKLITTNDEKSFSSAIEKQPTLANYYVDGTPLLIKSLDSKNLNFLQMMLDKNPNPYLSDGDNKTLMHWVAETGNVAAFKIMKSTLEKQKFKIATLFMERDVYGNTPIELAIQNDKAEIFEALIDAGSTQKQINHKDQDIVESAFTNNSYAVLGKILALVKSGSLAGYRDAVENTLKQKSSLLKLPELLEFTFKIAESNNSNLYQLSLDIVSERLAKLIDKAHKSKASTDYEKVSEEFFQPLSELLANARLPNQHINKILHTVKDLHKNQDFKTTIEKILEAESKKLSSKFGLLLLTAVANKDKESVEFFLPYTKKYVKDQDGNSPIHLAVKNGDKEILNMLMIKFSTDKSEYGANNEGNTPLHIAAETGNTEIAKTLLDKQPKSASPIKRNKLGLTPSSLAKKKGYEQLASLLDNGGDESSYQKVFKDLKANISNETVKTATSSEIAKQIPKKPSDFDQLWTAAHFKTAPAAKKTTGTADPNKDKAALLEKDESATTHNPTDPVTPTKKA